MDVRMNEMIDIWQELVIFEISPDCDNKQYRQFKAFDRYIIELGIPIKELTGFYKGKTNVSFMVGRNDFEAHILKSGWVDAEESFLYLSKPPRTRGGYRTAELVFQFDQVNNVQLGYFRPMAYADAIKHDGWTFDRVTNTYWVAG